MRGWMKQIMVWLVAAACGFAAALVICRWSGNAFGLFMCAGHCRGGRVRGGRRGIFYNRRKE